MYEGNDRTLYVLVNKTFYPCRVSVSTDGAEVKVIGNGLTSRPKGAKPVTLESVIVRYGLADGGSYPATQHSAQPEVAPVQRKQTSRIKKQVAKQ